MSQFLSKNSSNRWDCQSTFPDERTLMSDVDSNSIHFQLNCSYEDLIRIKIFRARKLPSRKSETSKIVLLNYFESKKSSKWCKIFKHSRLFGLSKNLYAATRKFFQHYHDEVKQTSKYECHHALLLEGHEKPLMKAFYKNLPYITWLSG